MRQAKPGSRHAWRGYPRRFWSTGKPLDADLDGHGRFDTDKNTDDLPNPPLFGCTMNHTTPLIEGPWDSFEDAVIAVIDSGVASTTAWKAQWRVSPANTTSM